MNPHLAPCIAVVGPANSGKTTLITLLDQALRHHPDAPVSHMVKGNPDGAGLYLLHAPEVRETLKTEVKGRWIRTTSATISAWIANSRAHIEIVFVDLGGKHNEVNDYIPPTRNHPSRRRWTSGGWSRPAAKKVPRWS